MEPGREEEPVAGAETGTTPIDTGRLVKGVMLVILNAEGGTEVEVGRARALVGTGGARLWSTEGRELAAGEDMQCLRIAL